MFSFLMENPSQSYVSSPAIYEHTVLPARYVNAPRITQAFCRKMKWVDLGTCWLYRCIDGLP